MNAIIRLFKKIPVQLRFITVVVLAFVGFYFGLNGIVDGPFFPGGLLGTALFVLVAAILGKAMKDEGTIGGE